jgi:oligoribonuclease
MSTSGVLVWMDMEMSGLDPERDAVLELATLVTDADLNVLAEGPELVVHQHAALFDRMDDWCKEHHTKSGLWQRVLDSKLSLADAERQTLDFLKEHTGPRESPLCGNSIWQDRRFLAKHMPTLEAHLHYRIIDVSTVKELVSRWSPEHKFPKKKGAHRALDDIRESLDELRHYRATVFKEVSRRT